MFMDFFIDLLGRFFGTRNDRIIKKYRTIVTKINELENEFAKLSLDDLCDKRVEFMNSVAHGVSLDTLLVPAFATVREVSKRVLSMKHFDVQLIGGIVLHEGKIAEMKTGEGKTLVATLPVYLNSLTGRGVHIVTVNDYLVSRDKSWMSRLYAALGMTCGCVVTGMSDDERRDAYNADVTYVTNNELGFDYLRDNMKTSIDEFVQKEINFAIIDEVDSILIDEARTPLVISGSLSGHSDEYKAINALINKNVDSGDIELDEQHNTVSLSDDGFTKIESLLLKGGILKEGTSLYDVENISLMHHLDQSLRAHWLFERDKDYIVVDEKVAIIDEFTGRVMDGRRYSDGLHQAIEAKEGVEIQNENQMLASVTYQNYFRLYKKLAGMTGTAMTESTEFSEIYNLDVVSVPTHLPVNRADNDDEIYSTKREKYDAVIKTVIKCQEKKQPVLIGTISIEQSEHVADLLRSNNIKVNVLNAKYHEQEASIIAQAGKSSSVTIATNMAGRGTDIKLGGNPEFIIEEKLCNVRDPDVYAERVHEIEEQVAKDRELVLEAGGLYVIGTERHESRRIDNQLRGRSGRQGDIGCSKFFLSLEDDLLRLFGSDRISSVLHMCGLKEGEAIQHSMVSNSLEKAQARVEARNYDVRKYLLKFDDIINEQRKVIFSYNREIMEGNKFGDHFNQAVSEINEELINIAIPKDSYVDAWKNDYLASQLIHNYGTDFDICNKISHGDMGREEVLEYINNQVMLFFNQKEEFYGKEVTNTVRKKILLSIIVKLWCEHLSSLDHLKRGVSLRAIGQKDPLNEFKKESFELFQKMLDDIKKISVQHFAHFTIQSAYEDE